MFEARAEARDLGMRAERRAYWREHIERWRQSGQRKQAICRTHGLNPEVFSVD